MFLHLTLTTRSVFRFKSPNFFISFLFAHSRRSHRAEHRHLSARRLSARRFAGRLNTAASPKEMTSNQENERSGIKKIISKDRGNKSKRNNPTSPSIATTPGTSPSVTPTPLAPHRSSPLSFPVIPHTISPRSSIPASSPLPPTTAPVYYPPALNTPSQVPQNSQYAFIPPPPYVGPPPPYVVPPPPPPPYVGPPPPYVGPSTWYPPTTGPPQYYFPGYFPHPPNQTSGAGPSTPCPPCSQPTEGQSQSSTGTEEMRIFIQPEGETFNPGGAIYEISDIIEARFDAPYSSWKKIPVVVRDMWFKDFERSFRWLPEHHMLIRRNFDKLASARLRDMLNTARRSGKRPDWMEKELWDDLCTIWESKEYIQREEQNKKKRASDCDGLGSFLHTGGSIPTRKHKRRMEKTPGREPTLSELHTRIHQRRSDSSRVDLKSANIHEKYTQLKEAASTQSSAEGSSSQESKVELLTQVTGGHKKGRLYGVGSHSTTLNMPSTYNMGASIDAHIQKIVDKKVEYRISTIERHIHERMQAMEAEHRQMMQKMYSSGSTFYPPPLPPNQGDVKDEEDDEEDTDEEN